ncbi:unnamed protein product [Protopolystoma xenopodis]|uniref:Uncharacterized protein n=1 Tax=Protopolystoma xenopodis TaxID=117903 RepID=A0A448WTR6_9PLAT|nr:unnamed protein product [Protopolystoma xenopodis]
MGTNVSFFDSASEKSLYHHPILPDSHLASPASTTITTRSGSGQSNIQTNNYNDHNHGNCTSTRDNIYLDQGGALHKRVMGTSSPMSVTISNEVTQQAISRLRKSFMLPTPFACIQLFDNKLGVHLPSEPDLLADCLKSGALLCRLVNRLVSPDAVKEASSCHI